LWVCVCITLCACFRLAGMPAVTFSMPLTACRHCSLSGWGPLSSSRRGTSSSPGFARNCSQNHRSSSFCEVDVASHGKPLSWSWSVAFHCWGTDLVAPDPSWRATQRIIP
jgi:hypothetical protein